MWDTKNFVNLLKFKLNEEGNLGGTSIIYRRYKFY